MRCTRHSRRDCSDARCRNERDNRRTTTAADDSITDPLSPLHQAAYGGAFYGSGSDSGCDTSSSSGSSSSYDSGTSSCGDSGGY